LAAEIMVVFMQYDWNECCVLESTAVRHIFSFNENIHDYYGNTDSATLLLVGTQTGF
jgi:hypothetical protein